MRRAAPVRRCRARPGSGMPTVPEVPPARAGVVHGRSRRRTRTARSTVSGLVVSRRDRRRARRARTAGVGEAARSSGSVWGVGRYPASELDRHRRGPGGGRGSASSYLEREASAVRLSAHAAASLATHGVPRPPSAAIRAQPRGRRRCRTPASLPQPRPRRCCSALRRDRFHVPVEEVGRSRTPPPSGMWASAQQAALGCACGRTCPRGRGGASAAATRGHRGGALGW